MSKVKELAQKGDLLVRGGEIRSKSWQSDPKAYAHNHSA